MRLPGYDGAGEKSDSPLVVRDRFPIGFVILLVVTVLIYAMTTATVADSRSSDAAGNAMSAGFAAIFAIGQWVMLTLLLLMARLSGGMPRWAAAALMILGPGALFAYFVALDRFSAGDKSALILVIALPALLILYALWARFPGWHGALPARPTSVVLLGVCALLSAVAIGGFIRSTLPDPERDARLEAEAKAQEERRLQEDRAAREREAAEFAALGPDSPMADYLIYLHSTYADRALEGIQKVKNRQADAIALLETRPLADLADLWQFNVVPTLEVCGAYGTAFTVAADRVTTARSDYISAAIDLEWQLPNLKWLVTAKCDLSSPLERAATNVRAVADSDRLRNLAATFAEIRERKPTP